MLKGRGGQFKRDTLYYIAYVNKVHESVPAEIAAILCIQGVPLKLAATTLKLVIIHDFD